MSGILKLNCVMFDDWMYDFFKGYKLMIIVCLFFVCNVGLFVLFSLLYFMDEKCNNIVGF